jgi:hypothetical protein
LWKSVTKKLTWISYIPLYKARPADIDNDDDDEVLNVQQLNVLIFVCVVRKGYLPSFFYASRANAFASSSTVLLNQHGSLDYGILGSLL